MYEFFHGEGNGLAQDILKTPQYRVFKISFFLVYTIFKSDLRKRILFLKILFFNKTLKL